MYWLATTVTVASSGFVYQLPYFHFWLDILRQACWFLVTSMGGILVIVPGVCVPLVVLVIKGLRQRSLQAMRAHWKENVKDTMVAAVVVWTSMLLFVAFYKMPKDIRKQASKSDRNFYEFWKTRTPQLPTFWALKAPPPIIPPLLRHVVHPTGFLRFDTPEVAGSPYNEITIGKQFGMNFRSRNNSPERVLRTFGYTAAYILPATQQSDRVALSNTAHDLKIVREKYVSGEIHGPEIAAGSGGIWGTAFLHLHTGLTQPEVDGIISKQLRIYYVSRLVWTDLQNRMDWSDDCRWLQIPDTWPYAGELVWHFCDPPN
jgi:heme/copper-type cytochrome/quinol oxidase subunit 2